MKVTMNDPILNIDGTELKNEKNETVILVDLIITACTITLKSETEDTGDNMLKKWDLAQRAHNARGTTMELTLEEATFIKDRIRKAFSSTIIYANAHRILESANK